jgi:hypothetical protein
LLNYIDIRPGRVGIAPAQVMQKRKKHIERVFEKDQSVWRSWQFNDGEE